MAKKNLQSIATALRPTASMLPTQNVAVPQRPKVETPEEPADADRMVQYSFGLRESLRTQLQDKAREAGMPVRTFIMHALKASGLTVPEEDLLDQRKVKKE